MGPFGDFLDSWNKEDLEPFLFLSHRRIERPPPPGCDPRKEIAGHQPLKKANICRGGVGGQPGRVGPLNSHDCHISAIEVPKGLSNMKSKFQYSRFLDKIYLSLLTLKIQVSNP